MLVCSDTENLWEIIFKNFPKFLSEVKEKKRQNNIFLKWVFIIVSLQRHWELSAMEKGFDMS